MVSLGSGSRDRLAADPSPRLRLGTFNGRRPTRESLIGNGGGATRFPFPLPPRTIGEQKAKVKSEKIAGSGSVFRLALIGTWLVSRWSKMNKRRKHAASKPMPLKRFL